MVENPMNNPFATAYQQAMRAAEEMGFKPANFGVPDIQGSNDLLAAYKKNLDAMSEANRIALTGAQSVASRHMEIVQQTMAELSENLRAMASIGSPTEKVAKQSELLRQVCEHAARNTRELAELIQKTNEQAVSVLNQRVTEALEEVKGLIDKQK